MDMVASLIALLAALIGLYTSWRTRQRVNALEVKVSNLGDTATNLGEGATVQIGGRANVGRDMNPSVQVGGGTSVDGAGDGKRSTPR